jgi:hypothetical protein
MRKQVAAGRPSRRLTSLSTRATCPPTRTGKGSCPRTAPSGRRSATQTQAGGHRSAVSTRKSGGFYGCRLHAAACARTDLPLAWEVQSARQHESLSVPPLLETLAVAASRPRRCALDMGYDVNPVYEACQSAGTLSIMRQTTGVKRGDHLAPAREHGTWTFAGADFKRKQTKWRCPTGECAPASVWRKANRLHPLVPRETKRWRTLYRGRGSVERAFGRLKNEGGLAPVRVRGLDRWPFTPTSSRSPRSPPPSATREDL